MSLAWRSYLVCTTARSGSNLLCDYLARSGVAGWPREYYGKKRSSRSQRFYGLDQASYFQWIQGLRTGPNGIFSAKVMYRDVERLCSLCPVAQTRFLIPRKPSSILTDAFPDLHLVHLQRQDRLGQALSLERALQCRIWKSSRIERARYQKVHYNYLSICRRIRDIHRHEENWRHFFKSSRNPCLHVTYEALVQDPGSVTKQILAFLGLQDEMTSDPLPSKLRPMADDLTASWREQFLQDAKADTGIRAYLGVTHP